jgi:hypothetical protein
MIEAARSSVHLVRAAKSGQRTAARRFARVRCVGWCASFGSAAVLCRFWYERDKKGQSR